MCEGGQNNKLFSIAALRPTQRLIHSHFSAWKQREEVLVLIMGRRLWYRVLRLFVFLRIIKIIENKFEQPTFASVVSFLDFWPRNCLHSLEEYPQVSAQ